MTNCYCDPDRRDGSVNPLCPKHGIGGPTGATGKDNIIKNPTRNVSVSQKKYSPEYVRLNVEPIPMSRTTEEFSSVDGTLIDANDEEYTVPDSHIIDNNDVVDFGLPEKRAETSAAPVTQPKIGDYVLMVFGKLILTGPLDQIQNRVKQLIYGEDSTFANVHVSSNDIIVLKRIGIKIGVFIEE